MGQRFTVQQNDFSHGMQSETRNRALTGPSSVFGASLIKHFDIYKNANKLIPNPSFERFNTDVEKDYGIVAIGGESGSIIYGLGEAITNWYSKDWPYRATLTPDTTGGCDYMVVDLSQMGSDFWDNIQPDGSDIKVTYTGTLSNRGQQILDLDKNAQTGYLLVEGSSIQTLDIYWGATASGTSISNTYTDLFSSADHAYPLDSTLNDFIGSTNLDDADVEYTQGKMGNAVTDSTIDSDGVSYGAQDEGYISFLIKLDSAPASQFTLINVASDYDIYITSGGNIRFTVDLASGTADITSSSSIADGEWHFVTCGMDDFTSSWIYIDGVEEATQAISYAADGDSNQMSLAVPANVSIQFLTLQFGSPATTAKMIAEGTMHADSATFWTVGTTEEFTSITPEYGGVALYTKDISASTWEPIYSGGWLAQPTASVYPFPGFISYSGTYFFLTNSFNAENNYGGFLYGGAGQTAAGFDPIDVDGQLLDFRESTRPLPQLVLPVDNEYYFVNGGAIDNFTGGTFTEDVYDPYPTATSAVPYGYSLAITGTRRERGSIEVWDLTGADSETVIQLGAGDARVIANVKGALVAVVDNYIEDAELSRGVPSLDFRVWLGQDNVKTLQSFPFDVLDTTYTYAFQRAIDNRYAVLDNATVFFGAPATSWTGFWAVGAGEQNQRLAVSIAYDTSAIGFPLQHHARGNNLVIIDNDLAMWKLNDDGAYTQASVFESMVVDAGAVGIKKHLSAVEVTLDKDLPVGQTISLEYRVDNGDWQTVGDCDSKATEFAMANGSAFDSFYEMEVRITSSGGDAAITSWSIRGEYEQEIV